jgi:hypothetical protein
MAHASVGDLRILQIELFERRQSADVHQVIVADFGALQRQDDDVAAAGDRAWSEALQRSEYLPLSLVPSPAHAEPRQ